MESRWERLRPWQPEAVLISQAPGAPMEDPVNPVTFKLWNQQQAIFVRNLAKRTIEKACDLNRDQDAS